MNIFRILSSGKHTFREEFVSAFLAYLLSPKMDHGLGGVFLSSLLNQVAEKNTAPELRQLTQQLRSRLWENIFEENWGQPIVELEVSYPGGWIDIVIRIGNWFVLLENKILAQSKTDGQIKNQYAGLQQVLKRREFEGDCKILILYVVPAIGGEGGWSVSPAFNDELRKVELRPGDQKALVTWQPVEGEDEPISIVATIREILRLESLGMMAPISLELRQSLLSLVDYVMSGFQGYHYEAAVAKRAQDTDKRLVSDILQLEGDFFVGVQYGRGGLVSVAWRNPEFLGASLVVTADDTHGWQYLPLQEFKTFVRWALNPEQESLQGIEWIGKPFWVENLYRVAKWGKTGLYVGIKGGIPALEAMTVEEIQERKAWELSMVQKNSHWMTADQFCQVLESKGLTFN